MPTLSVEEFTQQTISEYLEGLGSAEAEEYIQKFQEGLEGTRAIPGQIGWFYAAPGSYEDVETEGLSDSEIKEGIVSGATLAFTLYASSHEKGLSDLGWTYQEDPDEVVFGDFNYSRNKVSKGFPPPRPAKKAVVMFGPENRKNVPLKEVLPTAEEFVETSLTSPEGKCRGMVGTLLAIYFIREGDTENLERLFQRKDVDPATTYLGLTLPCYITGRVGGNQLYQEVSEGGMTFKVRLEAAPEESEATALLEAAQKEKEAYRDSTGALTHRFPAESDKAIRDRVEMAKKVLEIPHCPATPPQSVRGL